MMAGVQQQQVRFQDEATGSLILQILLNPRCDGQGKWLSGELNIFCVCGLKIRANPHQFQSIICTIADGEDFIDSAIKSVLDQTIVPLECVLFLDHCLDKTEEKLLQWREKLSAEGINLKLIHNKIIRKGVGFGRNRAIESSTGNYLCFLDIDDVMYSRRIELQLEAARKNSNAVNSIDFPEWSKDFTPPIPISDHWLPIHPSRRLDKTVHWMGECPAQRQTPGADLHNKRTNYHHAHLVLPPEGFRQDTRRIRRRRTWCTRGFNILL